MSHLIDDDGLDDPHDEQDNNEEDEDFLVNQGSYKKKKKKNLLHAVCHFCGVRFIAKKQEYVKNYPKCKKCKSAGVTRKIILLEKKCAACKETFQITSHMRKIQKNGKKSWRVRCSNCRTLQKAPRGPIPKPGRNYFECDMCGKSYKARHLIYQHMETHRTGDDLECKVCHKISKNRSVLRTHLRSHFERFICHLCGFIGKTAYVLRHHMNAHEADPNQVKDCTNFVKSRFDKKLVERGEFPCKYCGYCYSTKTALQSHEIRRHETTALVQDFKCKVCGEVFQHANDMRVHNYSHSTRPLIFCEYPGCSQFFNRIKPLNAHIRNVHKEKNIVCETCNKKFKMKGSLVKHLKNKRCIPVQIRKVNSGKASLPGSWKSFKSKSVDQLAEDAAIAKEQFRTLGGMLKDETVKSTPKVIKANRKPSERSREVFHDSNDSDWYDNDSYDNAEKSKIDEVKVNDESDSKTLPIDIKREPDDVTGDLKPIPMMKIEIKMEPIENSEHEGLYYIPQDVFAFDNFSNPNESMNPSVVLEKLDYGTLMEWQKRNSPRPERSTIHQVRQKRIFKDKYMEKYKAMKKSNLTCDDCGHCFNKKWQLKEHIYEHGRSWTYKNFPCRKCKEEFFFRDSLKFHMKQMHSNKTFNNNQKQHHGQPFVCDMCGNFYNSYTSISSHLKIVHKKSADFCCHICPSQFKTKVYLQRHVEDVHEKIMRFQCNFCGKFFKRKHQVKEHEKLHNDPVGCPVVGCGKMVRNLKTHIKQVHEMIKKPEQACCSECGQLINIHNMQHHIDRIHRRIPIPGKVYPCILCEETFNRADDLRRHKYTTHLEKPLKACSYEGCGGIFPSTKSLNNHIRNVHREGQLNCQFCNKSFNSESGIRKHLANKHKAECQET